MPKFKYLRPLTNKEKRLIEDNYEKVKSLLYNKIRKNKISYFLISSGFESEDDVLDQILSYLVEAAQRVDYNKSKNFVTYATEICMFRFMDYQRSTMKLSRLEYERKLKVNKIKDNLVKQNGYAEMYDIYKEMKSIGMSENMKSKMFDFKLKKNVRYFQDPPVGKDDSNIKILEWEDFKINFINNIKKINFGNDDKCKKDIILNNIIPKCENKKFFTYSEISSIYNLSQSYISDCKKQIIKNKQFLKLISELKNDV